MNKQITNQKLTAIRKLAEQENINFNELKPYIEFVVGMWGTNAKASVILAKLILIYNDFKQAEDDPYLYGLDD